MANPSKAKGTAYENELLFDLRRIWPEADRAKTNNPSNDFHGVPFPIEAKHRHRWDLKDWARKIRRVALHGPSGIAWAIFVADGDRRTADSAPDVMVVDRRFGMELLEAWWRR